MNETLNDVQLFAELYDVHPQAIIWMRPLWAADGATIQDFEFAYANEEGLHYLALTREQFTGMRLSTSPALTDELRPWVLSNMIAVYQTGQKSEFEIFNPALNKWARALRTRLRNGVLTVVQDITEEKNIIQKLEAQSRTLQEQKSLLDSILANSSNGISVSQMFRNEEGAVVDAQTILANDAAVKFIGIPRELYLTKRATELEPAVIGSPYHQACVHTLETGEPFVMQYWMVSTERWLELTVSRLDSDHLIHVFSDVTPIKQAQLQLEKTVEELKRSNTHLEDFAHAASHDMKEPLRKIRTFVDRLRAGLSGRLSDSELGFFTRIDSSAERMQLLVDDLLEFSHVSEGARQQPERVNLTEKLQKVLSDLELSIEEKGATITIGALPTVLGHRRQLQQLFQNLVGNALKYNKPGVPPHITVSSSTVQGGNVLSTLPPEAAQKTFHLIEVTDNGIGFEPQYAEQIFEMFQRLHGKAEYSGTGVGLAIARKVVQNHGGYIWASSQPGEGATFSVLLPAEE